MTTGELMAWLKHPDRACSRTVAEPKRAARSDLQTRRAAPQPRRPKIKSRRAASTTGAYIATVKTRRDKEMVATTSKA